jgi:polysaccharide deacetylase 2 family uncharacterized protein YibQ
MKIRSLFLTFSLILLIFLSLLGFRSGKIQQFSSQLINKYFPKNSLEHPEFSKRDLSADQAIESCFDELEITESNIKRQFSPEDSTISYEISVPRGKPMEWIVWFLFSYLKKFNYLIKDCEYSTKRNSCQVSFASNSHTKPILHFKIALSPVFFSKTAKMAIIVEDFGFEADNTTVNFLSFPHPLTVSLVSTAKLSVWTAQIANEYKKEIIILLPMEPLPRSHSSHKESTIMVHYPQDRIVSMFEKAAESVPNFAGFSNLGGNRVMADSRVMKLLFSQIKKRHGYFIVNPTTRKSVADMLAQKMQVPYENIDFTIDTDRSSEEILESIRHFILSAHKTGKVLVKGKATDSFVKALNDAITVFKHNGIELVYVSEIIKHPEEN